MAGFRLSPIGGVLAGGSLGALWLFAPQGLWLLLFLGVVISTHEAGHLIAARRSGMVPTEYFWGFGPEVVGFDHKGCRYGIKAIFLGGYVKLHGMTPSSELPPGFDEAGTYRAASRRGRLATILAGPAVNLAMALVAFWLASVVEGESWLGAFGGSFGDLWFVISGTADALWLWVSNIGTYVASVVDPGSGAEAPVRFMSPVAQAEVSGWAVSSGWAMALRWFAILSCAIGFVNLLPLPPLDGSHAAVAATEAVVQRLRPRRRVRLDATRLVPVAYLTVAVLVFLSLSALVLDVRDLG